MNLMITTTLFVIFCKHCGGLKLLFFREKKQFECAEYPRNLYDQLTMWPVLYGNLFTEYIFISQCISIKYANYFLNFGFLFVSLVACVFLNAPKCFVTHNGHTQSDSKYINKVILCGNLIGLSCLHTSEREKNCGRIKEFAH